MTKTTSKTEDVKKMRELFWMKFKGEITQQELERRVNEITGKQLSFSCGGLIHIKKPTSVLEALCK